MNDLAERPRTLVVLAAVALMLTAPASSGWTQWRADAEHTGQASSAVPIHEPGELWSHTADQHPVASPATAEIDGETRTFVATYPADEGETGSVYALDADGSVDWQQTPSPLTTGGFVASPAVVDTDDGKAVIAAKAEDSTVYRLDASTGEIEASWQMGDANRDVIVSSPTIADVHGDQASEIVIGGSGSDDDGALFVLTNDLELVAEHEVNAPVWSSPLVTDLDDDGTDEVVASTGVPDAGCIVFGTLHPTNDPKTGDDQGRLYTLETDDGLQERWTAQLEGPTMSSPTAGDIDDDGAPEIVVGSQDERGSCTDVTAAQQNGFLEAYEDDGEAFDQRDRGLVLSVTTPLLHDLDEDGTPEIVHGTYNGLEAHTATTDALASAGSLDIVADDRHGHDHWVLASPTVVDLDDDGGSDLVAQSIPVDLNTTNPVQSEVKPGAVFAVSPNDDYGRFGVDVGPLTIDANGLEPRWVHATDEGGISGPIAADANDDGFSEVVAGTGFPVIGSSTTTHVIGPYNPAVGDISIDPAEPETLDEIAFTAPVTDGDHSEDELAYEWQLGDGTTTTEASPTHSYADDGTYTVQLDVTDPDGNEWTRQRTVDVANVAPDVDTEVTTTPGSLEVTLDATASDLDGSVQTVAWELGDGTTVQDSTVTHTYDTSGTYEATFTATDDDGDQTTVTREVSVNRFPSLSGPDIVQASEASPVTLSFPYDDPDGDAVTVTGIDNAPNATATVGPDAIEVTWTPPYDIATRADTPVPVNLTVHVEDDASPTGTANHTASVEVAHTNRAPTLTGADEVTASAGKTQTASGQAADADGDALELTASGLPDEATFDTDGHTWTIALSPTADADPGTYEATVTADDGLEQTSHSVTLTVVPNQPPSVTVEGPTVVDAWTSQQPSRATFEGQAHDPEGDDITRWTWVHDDVVHQGQTFTHAFRQHGTYDVQLTAQDEHGAGNATTTSVAVDDALTGGVAVLPSQAGPTVDRTVSLHVQYDDGTPLAGHDVELTLEHESFTQPTWEANVTTDADGRALATIEGDLGLGVFVPGQHTLTVDAEADSLPTAPVDDEESLTMTETFPVGLN